MFLSIICFIILDNQRIMQIPEIFINIKIIKMKKTNEFLRSENLHFWEQNDLRELKHPIALRQLSISVNIR